MEKGITLLDIKQYDTEFYFRMDNIGIEDINTQLKNMKNPMVDLSDFARSNGKQINQVTHAVMEQGSAVSLSVTVDLDSNELTLYETNKIAEDAKER